MAHCTPHMGERGSPELNKVESQTKQSNPPNPARTHTHTQPTHTHTWTWTHAHGRRHTKRERERDKTHTHTYITNTHKHTTMTNATRRLAQLHTYTLSIKSPGHICFPAARPNERPHPRPGLANNFHDGTRADTRRHLDLASRPLTACDVAVGRE